MKRAYLAVSILFALGAAAANAATVDVDFSPASVTKDAGQDFSLEIFGHAGTTQVFGGGLDLHFNPAVVQVNSVNVDAGFWDIIALSGTVDNGAGAVTDIAFARFAGPSGDFKIATVSFKAVAGGSSALTLANASDPTWAWGGDDGLQVVEPTTHFTPAQVTVNAVPVPAAVFLLGPAIAGLAWRRGRSV